MCLSSAIFDGPNDAASVAAIKSWRTNAVRIPMNEDCWLGINGISPNLSGAPYQQAIKDYVNLLNENGLYAILDLHWTAPATTKATGQMPMPDLDHAPTFWSQVASAFKGNDAVIFEPFNEPYPGVMQDSADSWTCWRDGGTCKGIAYETAGMQTLVDAIRATGATNAIALGGLQWSNLLSQWLAYKPNDPQNKIVAAWHMYSFQPCDTPACFGDTVGAVAAQVPLIATEIGTDTCDATFMNALMSWLDAHQTGYLAWRWDARPDDCTRIALITDYTGSPSTYGQVYKTHLADLP